MQLTSVEALLTTLFLFHNEKVHHLRIFSLLRIFIRPDAVAVYKISHVTR